MKIVTGGSRGIGAATAIAYAASGMGVILTHSANPGRAGEVVREMDARGGRAVALPLDVTDIAALPAFRADAVAFDTHCAPARRRTVADPAPSDRPRSTHALAR